MQNQQLGLFDDNATNVVGDDHDLHVRLAFVRREGEVTTASQIIINGDDGDYLDKMLEATAAFLRQLGFTWVEGLRAYNDSGDEV